MSNTIQITVEDIDERLAAGYVRIELVSATTPEGTYSTVVNTNLEAEQPYYTITHSSGTELTWYKYRFTGTAGGAPISPYSNPFQSAGLSRGLIRRRCIEEYKAGIADLPIVAGGSTSIAKFGDYRITTSLFASRKGVGTWLHPQDGALVGQTRRITTSNPTTGEYTISPVWAAPPVTGTLMEWHSLSDPDDWNIALNRALRRYAILERVPITGNDDYTYDLSYIPWLKTKRQVHGTWWTPSHGWVERPFGSSGRWWNIRQDHSALTLITNSRITDAETFYLEATRFADPVYTDASEINPAIDEETILALLYDEILSDKMKPSVGGAAVDRAIYYQARQLHQSRIKSVWDRFNPQPRYQNPQTSEPIMVPKPFRSR